MSEEIVSGVEPPGIAASATVKSKLPPPWPTSKITPRCLAASAAGSSLPSCTILVKAPARSQQVADPRHHLPGFDPADMDHHLRGPAAHLAGLDAALERLEPVFED